MSIISEEIVIHAISHPIRRNILQLLKKSPHSFTNLMDFFDITSAKLTYHLKNIQGFVKKDEDNFYQLSSLGEKAIRILIYMRNEITEEDQPMIKETFMGQKSNNPSMVVRGINILILAIGFVFFMSVSISIIAFLESDTPIFVYFIIFGIILGELLVLTWLINVRRKAPDTIGKLQSQWNKLVEREE